ncbi:hypothetical protein BP6252_10349 [Coleophoma cylindrospora]|uniref:Uncharacterized protein n=1 Tax=Coleophoma cylindrospora TaxID=1849047 RepID=A0A3D8QSP9_9HELO|nr:hypothetical protein BP6252_10349 [Coleophoma cylindrospora]
MAPKASQKELEKHLAKLCKELAQGSKGHGTIAISKTTCKALLDSIDLHNKHEESIPPTSVAKLLGVIDVEDNAICCRIDEAIFQALVAFFLNVLPAYGSQRGVYLLADALHQGHAEPNEHNFAKKKKRIGQGCSFVLLKYFIDSTRHTGMRRWMGVLLLQLLKECPDNVVYLLKVSGDYSRQLGDLIVNDNNEVIRIVSADIVEAVLKVGMSAVDLWPLDTKPNIYQHFPAKNDAYYWIKDLASYMDYLEEHKPLRDTQDGNHISGRLYYPQGILINPDLNVDFGKSLYMLLDNKELTIFSSGSANGFYCSLEMPLSLLVHPEIKKKSFVERKRAEALWDMILHPENTDRCYLNASDTCLKSVCIALPESISGAMKDEIELMAVQASRGHVPRASIVQYAIDDSDESHDLSEVDVENKGKASKAQESPFAKDSPDEMPSDIQPAASAVQVRNSPSEIPSKGDRGMTALSDDERTSSSGFLALLDLQHVDKSKILPTTKTPAGHGDEDEDSSRVRSDKLHNISPPKKTRNPTSNYRAINTHPQVDHENKLPTVDTPAKSSPNTTKSQQRNDRDRAYKLTPQETLNRPFRAPSKVANGVNSLKRYPLRQVVRSPNKSSIEGQIDALEESPQPPLIFDNETSPSEHDASTPRPQSKQVETKPIKVLEADDARQKFTPNSLPGFRDSGLQTKKDNIVANTQNVSQSNDSVNSDRANDAKTPLEGKRAAQRQETSTVRRTQETQKKSTSLKAKQPLDVKKAIPPPKTIPRTQVEAKRESMPSKPASHPESQGPKLLKTNKKSHSTREVDKTHHDQKDVFEIPKDNEQEESELQSGKAKMGPKVKPNKGLICLKLPSKKKPRRVAGKSREPALSALGLQEPQANPRRSNRVANKKGRRVNYTEIDEEFQNPLQPEEGAGSLEEPVTKKAINTDPKHENQFQQTKVTRAEMTGNAILSKRKSSIDDEKTSNAVGKKSDRGQRHDTSVDNTAMDSGPSNDRARSVGDSKTATSKYSNGVAMAKSLESILADLDTSPEGVDVGLAMDGELAQDLNANFDLKQDRDGAYEHSQDHRPISIGSSSSKSVSPDPEVETALADEVVNQPVEYLIKKAASKNAEKSAHLHTGSSVELSIDSASPLIEAALADSCQSAEFHETDGCDQTNDVEQVIETNENGKRTSPNAPITPAKRRKGLPKLKNPTFSEERSSRISRDIQLQDAAAIKQNKRRKRYTQPSTPPRRSPRLSAKAKQVTADLETVLRPLTTLVDEKKSRKPTIVNFGSTGPKNQGRPSILPNEVKESHVLQGRTAELHETKEYVRRPTRAMGPRCDNEIDFTDGVGAFKEDYMNISAAGEVTGDSVEPKSAANGVISIKTRETDDFRIQFAGGVNLSRPGNEDSISAPVDASWKDAKNGYTKIEKPSRRPCNDLKTTFTRGTLKDNKETQCTSSLPHDQMALKAGAAQRKLHGNFEVNHARATKQPEMALIDNTDLGYTASAESSAIMSSTQRKRKRTAANTIAGQPFIKSPQMKRGIERDRHNTNASDEENRRLNITTIEYPPQRRRNPRYSSQSSRVNLNGSPLASQKVQPVDHIGKVSKVLFRHSMQEQDVLVLASPEPQPARHSARNDRRADAIAPHRFARMSSSISKAKPSSPEHEEPRYVPHKRNLRTGAYEGMDGSEIIADDQVLPDPFTGKARRVPNGFSKRLQESQIDGREDMFAKVKRIFGEDHEPDDGTRSENEETLVNSVDVDENTPSNRHSSNSSPMLRQDLSSQVDTEKDSVGHWLLATKPHYKDLFQVQDFIIEEMRIRLAEQENAIHAVWQQYRDKGNTLLQQWETKRGDQMLDIMENLENQRSHLLTVCGEARDSLNSISNSLRSSPTDFLEKDWQRKQADIQALLAENMSV